MVLDLVMTAISRGPAYRIETERLVIRCWQPTDAPALQEALLESLDHLRPWMPWAGQEPEPLEGKIQRLRRFRGNFDMNVDFVYAILNADESEVLGGTGLHPRAGKDAREIGYWVHKSKINNGVATEATAALTQVAFLVDKVHRVEIHCAPTNLRSAAVPQKLGFTHDGTLRQRIEAGDGTYRDRMVWSMLSSEFPGSVAAAARIKAFDAVGRDIDISGDC